MSTSNQSYKRLSIPYFKEVFDLIDAVFREFGINFYLVGANAIALQILKKSNSKPPRGTKDIDFAIMVPTIAKFEEIMDRLVSIGFVRAKNAPNTLIFKNGATVVDILPFGKIEEEFTENFNQRRIDLHVLGFSEVLADSESVLIEDLLVDVPSLPGMVVLKLVSYQDRPEDRQNDVYDILYVIENFYSLQEDEILEKHFDIIETLSDYDRILIAAQVLGRQASKYLKQNQKLKDKVVSEMEKSIHSPEKSGIAMDWSRRRDWELMYAVSVLEALFKGMREKLE
jgi:predicted nucleotidyltransferase